MSIGESYCCTFGKVTEYRYSDYNYHYMLEDGVSIREEVGEVYLTSLKVDWYNVFEREGCGPDDALPGMQLRDALIMTVGDFVAERLRMQKDRIDNMSVWAWWDFEFHPHPLVLDKNDILCIARMEQPNPPTGWIEPWQHKDSCPACGAVGSILVRDPPFSGESRCLRCVDTRWGGA